MFQHHPDGWIIINGVMFPLAFFKRMEPDYALADGFIGRTYVPNSLHVVYTGSSETPLSNEWPEGDNYLAKLAVYQLAFARSNNRKTAETNPLKRRIKPLWQ